jgi:RNA polymerase sigma-B factor
MVRNGHARSNAWELLRRYHVGGDVRARETLILECVPLVRVFARRFTGRGEPFEDLFQVGMVGLIKAVDRFDVSRGVEFSAFAVPAVIGEIKRHFRDRTALVRVPRPTQELAVQVRKSAESLTQALGREPTIAELAEVLELPTASVLTGVEAGGSFHVASLSSFDSDRGDSSDPMESLGGPDGGFALSRDRMLLRSALSGLDNREQQVIVLRYVFDLTQSQIAARVGLSQMHVSRLLSGATRKMQLALGPGERRAA